MLFHLTFVGGVNPPSGLMTAVRFGGSGVMLFFVVSCFSLFFTMPGRLRQSWPVFSFYIHRLFRIAPLFYLWIVIESLLYHQLQAARPGPGEIVENVFFAFNLFPDRQTGIVMASWTIGVEMLFYAIFPLIYFKTKSLVHAVSLTVGTMLVYEVFLAFLPRLPVSGAAAASYGSWFFLKDLPIFAFGAICFFCLRDRLVARASERERALGTLLILIALYVILARNLQWVGDGIFGGHPYVWPAIAYSLLLVGLSLNPLKFLVNRVTQFLGEVSYSLYLAHAPVIVMLMPVYGRIRTAAAGVPLLGYIFCVGLTFAVVLPLSYLTYRFIELPGIKLGKRFYAYFERRKMAASVGPLSELSTNPAEAS